MAPDVFGRPAQRMSLRLRQSPSSVSKRGGSGPAPLCSPDRNVAGMTQRLRPGADAPNRPTDKAETTLEGLYRRYAQGLIKALRLRFGEALGDVADEVVQEAYIRAAPYHAEGALRQPRAFLLRVATNLAHDHIRRHARRGSAAPIEEIDEKAEHAVLAEQEEAILLKQLVLSLPPPLRDIFVLSRFAGMTNQDIAERYGLSVKTIEWRMTKALAQISQGLRR
jgi:RNA polymerase sigma factor (sigma-70 family)